MPHFGTLDGDGSYRRAGRPPLPPEQRLSAEKTLRFTQPGLEEVVRAASILGQSAAEFAREAALERARQINGRGHE